MKQVTMNVEGMSCNHCVNSIEGALKNAGLSGKVDLASNTVTVEYDETKATVEQIKETIEEQGYDVV
ncbi:copper chaperone [Paenibacillus uliginis N3/975]|uniref:Copper chaperone n=1 Tax=Paenibacillus uliginis N3/975 TaxID=1313296 RepID=A0A1X7HR91_9BACL|nr:MULTISPECIES: copper ion binding protein [Paenibacillus]UNK18989.1 copper ion binding protein [Paenibacillus sp. N3/727]SMF91503.1 copper chaperone [Paenibacillus uliginis N3/975]